LTERLQKLIARSGLCSRRAAEELLAAGRVRVNGEVAALGDRADPACDRIEVDGKPLAAAPELVYLMLNKPRGYVTTLADERGRATAAELVADCGTRVFPVGRLDRDSEGLLLMTNDGALAQAMLHPRGEVDKVYQVTVSGTLERSPERLSAIRMLDGERIRPAKVDSAPLAGTGSAGDHDPRGKEPPDPPDVPSGGAERAAAAARARAHALARAPQARQVALSDRGRNPHTEKESAL